MSSSYAIIRDDSGLRSLSINEQSFLRSCAFKEHRSLRSDGRRGNDIRKVRIKLGRWDNGAECTVQWGVGTRVTSLCTAELVPPSPDRPGEGMVNFTVDLSPMAGSSFKLAPPISTGPSSTSNTSKGSNHSDQHQRLLSNRILRCIERVILIGGALDTEALVLQAGKWVWRFTIAMTVLDGGGNILDACVLAAMAALRHYRKPQVDLSVGGSGGGGTDSGDGMDIGSMGHDRKAILLPTMIPSSVKEATPLPLHHTPLSISFGLIPADDAVNSASSTSVVASLIDPTDREELVQSGSLTIAMNVHSEVCLLDYGGGCELTPDKLKECWTVAETAIKELCEMLEATLSKADEEAQKDRLHLLQLTQTGGNKNMLSLPPFPTAGNQNIPYLQETDNVDDMEVDSSVDPGAVAKVQTEAEEAYRKLALDFSLGHIATAVREDDDRRGSGKFEKQASSLLAAMMKSVGQKSMPVVDTAKGDSRRNSAETNAIVDEPMLTEKVEKSASESEVTQTETWVSEEKSDGRPSVRKAMLMDLDDDDEEEGQPTVLRSEFGSAHDTIAAPADQQVDARVTGTAAAADIEIDDLSAAIIKKSSKKKKSKKK
jgi:exosome complex component RRP45